MAMQGTISFHPVDAELFEGLLVPLASGGKVNPEAFLERAVKSRERWWNARAYALTLEDILREAEPPPLPTTGKLWDRVRARLEQFDHRPSALARRIGGRIDVELHVHGRPFFITEGSAEHVAQAIDDYLAADRAADAAGVALEQLVRLDPQLGREVQPDPRPDDCPGPSYRSEVLGQLRALHDLADAARRGDNWGPPGELRRPAADIVARELPWYMLALHARVVPFWIARDLDGLETICRAAGVVPPPVLVPPRALLAPLCAEFPALAEALCTEMGSPRTVGAYVGPSDLPALLEFLNAQGSRIIQAATRHGVGAPCATLLRKMRECAAYASRHGMGMLEGAGILPPDRESAPILASQATR